MDGMFLVRYEGASFVQEKMIKMILRSLSGDVLERSDEEYCLIFYPKGKASLEEEVASISRLCQGITIEECGQDNFHVQEVKDFFNNIKIAQNRILST